MSFNPGDLVSLREKEKINLSGSASAFLESFPGGVAVVQRSDSLRPPITYLVGSEVGIFSHRLELCVPQDLGDML